MDRKGVEPLEPPLPLPKLPLRRGCFAELSAGLSLLAAGKCLRGARAPRSAAPLRPRPKTGVDAVGDRLSGTPRWSYVSSAREPNDVFQAARQPFDPGSASRELRIVYAVAVLRGGALEPESRTRNRKIASKSTMRITSVFFGASARESFSLRRGLDSVHDPFQAGHHLFATLTRFPDEKGDPVGSPSSGLLCG